MKRIVSQAHAELQASHERLLAPYIDPSFSASVVTWQKQHGRHALPWQQTRDAYRVWLSEIMLQQTQVTAVIPYYQRFLGKFPTVESLAQAPSEDVMALWSGLGYYTRARNLHQCAKLVVDKYNGRFPADPKLLQELPGIGRSTAAAIAAFSYGTLAAILDGNVKRVFARVFGIDGYPGSKPVEDDLWLRAQALLPKNDIESYTQGLMDLGATICTRGQPACSQCPLQSRCVALRDQRTAELPVRKPKKAIKEKQATMLVILYDDQILLEQRPNSGIWGGLLSLPELDGMQVIGGDQSLDAEQLQQQAKAYANRFGEIRSAQVLPSIVHAFTHFKLSIQPLQLKLAKRRESVSETSHAWYSLADAASLPLPAPIKTLLMTL